MRRWLFWPLLPLAVPQALWVRWRTPRSPDASGAPYGRFGTGDGWQLVGIGDSIIAGVGVARAADAVPARAAAELSRLGGRGVDWLALGRSGLNAAQIVARLVPALPDRGVSCFVVSVGVNDVTSLTPTRRWRRDLGCLLDRLHEHSPGAAIAVLGLPPMQDFPLLPWPLRTLMGWRAGVLDAIGAEVCAARRGVLHLPYRRSLRREEFGPDGYHPGEGACREVGAEVGRRLHEALAERGPAQPG